VTLELRELDLTSFRLFLGIAAIKICCSLMPDPPLAVRTDNALNCETVIGVP